MSIQRRYSECSSEVSVEALGLSSREEAVKEEGILTMNKDSNRMNRKTSS